VNIVAKAKLSFDNKISYLQGVTTRNILLLLLYTNNIIRHFVIFLKMWLVTVNRFTTKDRRDVLLTTVTTQAVGGAESGAGATSIIWWTSAVVTSDQVRASAAIKTRLRRARSDFTIVPYMRTPACNEKQGALNRIQNRLWMSKA